MKQILVILFSGMILMSCGDSLPPGEKAGEGSTGERVGASSDTTGNVQSGRKDTSSAQQDTSSQKAY